MSRKKIFDYCRICGEYKKLSQEHVPPQSAFNIGKIWVLDYLETIKKGIDFEQARRNLKRAKFYNGIYFYTICEKCNNETGSWYSRDIYSYSHFVKTIYNLYEFKKIYNNQILMPITCFPLRVIKQIVVMFLNINSILGKERDYLSNFVLNKYRTGLPPEYRFFIYYTQSNRGRMAPLFGKMSFNKSKGINYSEIAFPPLGYVMTVDSKPDVPLTEITHFANYQYNQISNIWLTLCNYPVDSPDPLDFKSESELHEIMYKNAVKSLNPKKEEIDLDFNSENILSSLKNFISSLR